MKFQLINKFKDFTGKDILTIGDIIEPDVEGNYNIKWNTGEMYLSKEEIESLKQDGHLLFKEIKDVELIIEEITEDDDNLVTNWRIQLDVKTTRKKLKEFENKFRESINNIL